MAEELVLSAGAAAKNNMLAVIDAPEYEEYADDLSVRRPMRALILRSARVGLELSRPTLDFAIEAFGRHGISFPEFNQIVGDISQLSAEDAENTLRVAHVALEAINAEGPDPEESVAQQRADRADKAEQGAAAAASDESDTDYSLEDISRVKVRDIDQVIAAIHRVEEVLEEPVDADGFLQFADEYRAHLIASGHENDVEEDELGHSRLNNIVKATIDDLWDFYDNDGRAEAEDDEEDNQPESG